MKAKLKLIFFLLTAFFTVGLMTAHAQENNPPDEQPSGGWRKFGPPVSTEPLPPPSTLNLPAGTWITVRVDQMLSSDRNLPGDAFTATLIQPLVANGRIIARRGQTVGGVVGSVDKGGKVKGTSRLGLALNELSLADGRQIPIRTTLMESRAGTSKGRDAAAIGMSTGMGAAIGGAIDGGFGAGMGAIAGAAASTIGVLITRGKSTVVYPEDQLVFRLENPLSIQTDLSGDAFQPAQQEDYDQPRQVQRRIATEPPPPGYYGGYYPPYYYGGYYSPFYFGGFYGPYFYGPSFGFYSHGHYGHHGGYHHHR